MKLDATRHILIKVAPGADASTGETAGLRLTAMRASAPLRSRNESRGFTINRGSPTVGGEIQCQFGRFPRFWGMELRYEKALFFKFKDMKT